MYNERYSSAAGNRRISVGKVFKCYKTADYFLEVTFKYPHGITFNGCIPLIEHYQNVEIDDDIDVINNYIDECYRLLDPEGENQRNWKEKQIAFWNDKRAYTTKDVFDALNTDRTRDSNAKTTAWMTREDLASVSGNIQAAARVRDLKKFGFTIATRKNGSKDEIILIRLPRLEKSMVGKRYGISRRLEGRIKTVLKNIDALTGASLPTKELIIDHKFPSARWLGAETRNFDGMTDDEIKEKFQLLTERENLAKSRACENCVQHGKRGSVYGIGWYYSGNENWNGANPTDEGGCVGCPFYDSAKWRSEATKKLNA